MTTDLRKHIARKAALIAGPTQVMRANGVPDARQTLSVHAEAIDETGVRRISVRGFHLLSDSGPGMGGYDLGPSSPELFLASLASCLCHVFLIQAAVRGNVLTEVYATAHATMQNGSGAIRHPTIPGYPHELHYEVEVASPEADETLIDLWRAVREHCPMFLLVSHGHEVHGTFSRRHDCEVTLLGEVTSRPGTSTRDYLDALAGP